jgi:hypothetical protein
MHPLETVTDLLEHFRDVDEAIKYCQNTIKELSAKGYLENVESIDFWTNVENKLKEL